jgi:hypothetical protein
MQHSNSDAIFDSDGTLIGYTSMQRSDNGDVISAYDAEFNYVGSTGHPRKAAELLRFHRMQKTGAQQSKGTARRSMLFG